MPAKRILIAEDDHEVLNLLSVMATKEGYHVVGVKDGIELLAACEKESFDLIITDLMMTHLNGLSATEILHLQGINVPVIALTGRTHIETSDIEDRFARIFHKPCNFKELFTYIRTTLDN